MCFENWTWAAACAASGVSPAVIPVAFGLSDDFGELPAAVLNT